MEINIFQISPFLTIKLKYIYIYILGQIQVHGIKLNMCIFKNGPTV